jgi:hypothetical protein
MHKKIAIKMPTGGIEPPIFPYPQEYEWDALPLSQAGKLRENKEFVTRFLRGSLF